jgi:RNA polymerase-binding transcription factor DksA
MEYRVSCGGECPNYETLLEEIKALKKRVSDLERVERKGGVACDRCGKPGGESRKKSGKTIGTLCAACYMKACQ